MDSRWFKEDRELPVSERGEAKEKSEKALKGSTLIIRRLTSILEEEVDKTYSTEESYEGEGWERKMTKMFERRKTLKEIIKLLP
jgi:hypothetical protein